MNTNVNKYWQYYENGRDYNMSLEPSQYALVDTNIEFFTGNQWLNMPDTEAMRRLPKPIFNIIKRIASLFIASLTSSGTTINFEPLALCGGTDIDDSATEAADFATAEVRNLLEKFKMDYRIRDALFDGAITGDYCAHFFWNSEALPYGGSFSPYMGEIEMELIDGINVMFGNPNSARVEDQPYIIIVGRSSVEQLKRECALWNKRTGADNDPDLIRSDDETSYMPGTGGKREVRAGSEEELGGKALYIYFYRKVWKETSFTDPLTGCVEKRMLATVHVTKATRSCCIYEDVDTGLTRYPLAWGNWERQKNSYHGRALVTGIVPNQISINLMMAMAILHTELESFPIRLFNADYIPGLSNEVGAAIGVRNLQPDQALNQLITTVQPADMSPQILSAIERVMEYTKECLGATDAQLGNVKPDNTSALMVLQSSAEVPLENIRAGLHEWIEDIGAILLDMMGTYYGERPIVREDAEGRKILSQYNFSTFRNLWLNIAADVGATTYYSEIAMVQTLDNLRRDGTLDVIDYLERIPDKLIPRKAELISKLKEFANQQVAGMSAAAPSSEQPSEARLLASRSSTQAAALKGGGYSMGDELDAAKKIAQLPTTIQAKYSSLPSVAQRSLNT